jgi:ribonuclease HII
MILGIDEVGRGPWAGPLVIGAVVLPDGLTIPELTDSKKLSAKKRVGLDALIRQQALGYGLGWVHAEELDTIGLSAALRLATIRAVEAVKAPYHEIIIDGTINFLEDTNKGQYVTTMAKADALVPAVSAASIIAKVARDAFMAEQDTLYTGYGFSKHVGYGTAAHQKALELYGVTPLHRRSFAPIKKLLGEDTIVGAQRVDSNGTKAEKAVAGWLAGNGFYILERNWKTKYCEIDIIAETSATRYFIEVKYRQSAKYGDGLEAITQKKLRQMRFAAELYNTSHKTHKKSMLAAVSLNSQGELHLVEVE